MFRDFLTTATNFFDRLHGHEDTTEADCLLHYAEPAIPLNSPAITLSCSSSMREVSINPSLRADKRINNTPRTIITGQLHGEQFELVGTLTEEESEKMFPIALAVKQKMVIGNSSFGKVRLARRGEEWIAVKKIIDINQAQAEIEQHLLVQKKLESSSYIVQLKDYALTTGNDGQPKAYLFMDFIDSGFSAIISKKGDLAGLLKRPNAFQSFCLRDSLSDLSRQCLEAVRDFHYAKLAHRDIKPENFLLSAWGSIKLANYASVQSSDDKKLPVNGFTYEYLPSAVVRRLPGEAGGIETQWSGEQRDRFALGIVLLKLRNRAQGRSDNSLLIHDQQHTLPIDTIRTAKNTAYYGGLTVDPKKIKGETLDEIIAILLFDKPKGESISKVLERPYFCEPYDKISRCAAS